MKNPININQLTTVEKIELMEMLWAELSRSADYSLPEWHKDELSRRKHAVSEDKLQYQDWKSAKVEIQEDLK